MWSDSFKLPPQENTNDCGHRTRSKHSDGRRTMALPTIDNDSAVRRLTLFRIALLIPVLLLLTWAGATTKRAGKCQMNGTVTDPSGPSTPGPKVIAKSKQTSLSTNTT